MNELQNLAAPHPGCNGKARNRAQPFRASF
jgi:hypothetical protein